MWYGDPQDWEFVARERLNEQCRAAARRHLLPAPTRSTPMRRMHQFIEQMFVFIRFGSRVQDVPEPALLSDTDLARLLALLTTDSEAALPPPTSREERCVPRL